MMKTFTTLTAALVLACSALASAATFPVSQAAQPDAKAKAKGGIVNSDGTIAFGSGFNSSHTATGEYTITYPAGSFKTCPVVNVTPSGLGSSTPIANIFQYACGGSGSGSLLLIVEIRARSNGNGQDNAFQFIANPL